MQPPRSSQLIDVPTQNRWLLGEDVKGVTFRMCDFVQVTCGPFAGSRGELISIIALLPEPEYHLETNDGGDCYVRQSEIALATG